MRGEEGMAEGVLKERDKRKGEKKRIMKERGEKESG